MSRKPAVQGSGLFLGWDDLRALVFAILFSYLGLSMLKFCDFTLAVVWLHPEPFYQGREWDARCLHLKYNVSFHFLDFHGWPTVLLMNGDIDWALLCMGLWSWQAQSLPS